MWVQTLERLRCVLPMLVEAICDSSASSPHPKFLSRFKRTSMRSPCFVYRDIIYWRWAWAMRNTR